MSTAKIILCSYSLAFLMSSIYFTTHSPAPAPENMSSEELWAYGQRYFNHGDNPSGAYELDKAKEYYYQLTKIDRHPQVWYQIGRIEFLQGDNYAALAAFDKQIEEYGDLVPKVYYMKGLTYGYLAQLTNSTDDWDKAEQYFLRYMEIQKYAPWPAVDLAWVYFLQGRFNDMQTTIEPAYARHPDNPWVLNMYSLALLNNGNAARAKEIIEVAIHQADTLTAYDWGKVYPGNNPAHWRAGLQEFRDVLNNNRNLIKS